MLSHSSCGRNAVHVLTRSPQRVGAEVRPRFMASPYPRDMVGYGAHPPHPKWPGEARVAVQFVLNYEEGSENCILHGDLASEVLSVGDRRIPAVCGPPPYEYGVAVRIWQPSWLLAAAPSVHNTRNPSDRVWRRHGVRT